MQNLNVSPYMDLPLSRNFEQFSYLLFLKQLDDRENAAERQAKGNGTKYQSKVPKWGDWTQMEAEEAVWVRTFREFFTNARMEYSRFEYSWFYSWMGSCFARVVALVESLRWQMGERQFEGLFESVLSESFGDQENGRWKEHV